MSNMVVGSSCLNIWMALLLVVCEVLAFSFALIRRCYLFRGRNCIRSCVASKGEERLMDFLLYDKSVGGTK